MARTKVSTILTNTKNLIINGNMRYAQRATSVVGTSGVQFVCDRFGSWFPAAGTYTSPSITQSSLPAGFPGLSSTTLSSRMVSTDVDNAGTFNRRQRIESIFIQDLTNISVGFWASVSNFQDCVIQILQPTTATDDDWATSSIIDQITIPIDDPSTTNNSWQYFKFEDVLLINNHGVEIRIIFSNPLSTSTTTDTYVTEIMCNEGSVVEAFSLAGNDEAKELTLCQRYFEKSYNVDTPLGTIVVEGSYIWTSRNSGNSIQRSFDFKVPKCKNPTALAYSTQTGTPNTIYNASAVQDEVVASAGYQNSMTVGNPTVTEGFSVRCHWSADAEL